MRILFLDDNEKRRQAFKQNSIGCVVDFACNADEALAFLLGEQTYDLIMLDHDLGGPMEEGLLLEDAKDGRYVVKGLVDSKKHLDTTIVVHSLNGAGAEVMLFHLVLAGYEAHYLPFGWRRFKKTEKGCNFEDDVGQVHPHEIDCPPE